MKKTKQEVIEDLRKAFIQAHENGFEIIVAGDSTYEDWNRVDVHHLVPEFADTNEKYIAIGVMEPVEEDEAFVIPDVPF